MFKVVYIRKIIYFTILFVITALPVIGISLSNSDKTELPVFMYHSILKDTKSTGKYVVTPTDLENDLKYLTDKGYKSVSAKEIIGYANGENELPQKPYLLTFDDGCYNNLTYLLPLLEKYDAYAVIGIVGSYSESFSELDEVNPAYSYLRWCDISEMIDTGRVEFANHSYDFHRYDHHRMGAKINKNEDKNDYKNRFESDTVKTHKLLLEKCNTDTHIYTYPYGSYCQESEEILCDNGYVMTLTCNEGINTIGKDINDLKLLKRYNRHGLLTTEEFFKRCKII